MSERVAALTAAKQIQARGIWQDDADAGVVIERIHAAAESLRDAIHHAKHGTSSTAIDHIEDALGALTGGTE